MITSGADQEVEVGATVGLPYVIYVEALPATSGIGEASEGGDVGSTAQQGTSAWRTDQVWMAHFAITDTEGAECVPCRSALSASQGSS